jgi:kynurenine formamidase
VIGLVSIRMRNGTLCLTLRVNQIPVSRFFGTVFGFDLRDRRQTTHADFKNVSPERAINSMVTVGETAGSRTAQVQENELVAA